MDIKLRLIKTTNKRLIWYAILFLISATQIKSHATENNQDFYWEWGLGSTYINVPFYTGSEERRNYATPIPYVLIKNNWLSIDRNQTQLYQQINPSLKLAFNLSLQLNVDSDEIAARQGMEDLDPLVEIGPSLEYLLYASNKHQLMLELPLRIAFTFDALKLDYLGYVINPKISYERHFLKTKIRERKWDLTLATRFANESYLEYYFGVPDFNATPDRPAFQPTASLFEIYASSSYSVKVENWQWGGYLRLSQFHQGNISNSPLVTSDSYISGGLYAIYTFQRKNN